MPVQLQAALISAGVSALAVVLGEVFLRQRARQATKQGIEATYRKYSEPLALSATELFWRLREVFDPQGKGFFLKGSVHLTRFEHYKALSTLYRIANLLGWIRALRRELFFIPGSSPEAIEDLDVALRAFASALAEGGHVEARRVQALMRLWDVNPDQPAPEAVARAGVQIDHQMKRFLHDKQVVSATDLAHEYQLDLSRLAAGALASALGSGPVADGVIEETLHRTMISLAVREAWVYRDWQAAIGDLMLREVNAGPRQFEVIGYKDFEALCAQGDEVQRVWLRRLHAAIDDLDVLGDRVGDARIDQLQEMYGATAKIIHALHRADAVNSRISADTRNAVGVVLSTAAA